MRQEINLWEYAGQILDGVRKGALLTTKSGDEINTMTIGWGHLGVEWSRPTFIVYVRQSRHTKTLLDKNPEFTVNIPVGAVDKKILSLCGTKSGRDLDKFKELGLTAMAGQTVSVPAIAELPLTLECKVIYQQDQELSALDPACREHSYPAGTAEENNFHTVYYGEITAAYKINDENSDILSLRQLC